MVDISRVNGIINQLITWGAPHCGISIDSYSQWIISEIPYQAQVRKWDFEGPEDMKIDPPVIKDQRWFVGKSPN